MFLLVGGFIMLVVTNVLGQPPHGYVPESHTTAPVHNRPNQLPDTFKDVFLAGLSGKPTLGTAGSTCWARGGICVDIRQCPELRMDVGVAGCSWGYKVCCKVHVLGSPTVGVLRRYSVPVIKDLTELGGSLEIIGLRNTVILSSWQAQANLPESDEIQLDDLLH